MAKITSPVWSIIRGSIAGTTYLANQYGQIIARQRTAPVQPGSTYQTNMRAAFAAAEGLWRTASDTEREDWALYAKTVQHPGPHGPYTLDGRSQFLSTFSLAKYLNNRFGLSIPLSEEAPVGTGWLLVSGFTTQALAAPGTGFQLNLTNDDDHQITFHLRISGPQNDTRNFWKGPWSTSRSITKSIAASSSGSQDFTGLTVGKAYFVSCRAISESIEHRISEEFIVRAIAETTV